MVEAAAGTMEQLRGQAEVPSAAATFLRGHNLPMRVRRGDDPRLEAMPWAAERTLEVRKGPSDGGDLVGVARAFGGAAESGTLMLLSCQTPR